MNINIDPDRGRKAARLLYDSFNTQGIHGRNDMPEDILPKGVERGSLDHLLFITFTTTIDYTRDANTLWLISIKTFEDQRTRYLYIPSELSRKPLSQIIADMRVHGLSKKISQDAIAWRRVGITLHEKWGGDPRKFLESCGWDNLVILKRLEIDTHLENGIRKPDFPFLKGPKISSLWIRMLRDNIGITKLKKFDEVPIPTDIHIARATLSIGVVRGKYQGNLSALFPIIRKAWFESVKGLLVDGRPMIALDLDEPLWHLSKYGCTFRDKETGDCPVYNRCEMKDFCVPGKINITDGYLELDT
jgi:hypothetical protein